MVAICKRRIGRLGCLLGLMVAVAVLAGAVWLGRGLLGLGKPRASALLRVAMEEQPIAFRLATAPTDRDHFEIYKCTQQQLVTSRFVLLAALRNPAVAQLSVIRHVRQKHDPVVWLQKHLCVHFPGHGELMEVSIAFDDPQEAVTLVQGVVDAYLHEVVNAEIDRRRQRLGELDRAVAEKQAEVRKEREALKKLAAELGTSETGTLLLKQKLVLEDLDSARQELSHVKSEVRRLKSDLASQKALLQNADVFNKLREEVKAEKLATIQAEVKRLEAALATTTADQQGLERRGAANAKGNPDIRPCDG